MRNSKTLKYHAFDNILVHSIICYKCSSNDEKIFKEEGSTEILKILGSINNINIWTWTCNIYCIKWIYNYFFKNMVEENISQEFRWNEKLFHWRSKTNWFKYEKHKKGSTTLNYTEILLILAFTVTGCVSISPFVSLLAIPTGIASSTVGLKICAITAGITKPKSIMKKKKKKHDKIVLLSKTELNTVEGLMFFISLQKLFSFLRKSKFRILHFQI